MADKILRVIFSGISTLHPGPPQSRKEEDPKEAFVLMAANKKPAKNEKTAKNDWGGDVRPHVTFVHVLGSLVKGKFEPDARDKDKKYNIYFLENARVSFDPKPKDKLIYHTDSHHDLAERPGSDDVANETDIRWLADLSRLVPVRLKSDPTAPGPEVANVIDLTGGTLKAVFQCKSEQAQTFRAAGGQTIPGSKRVLASEFSIEMTYPEKTDHVILRLQPLRSGASMKPALKGLTLQWPKSGDLVVRIGNDTEREALIAASLERCNARIPSVGGELMLRPRDDDFDLHYQLLNLPPKTPLPLPQSGPHQSDGIRCKPAGG
jgi:hypothetical protein